MHIVFKGVLLDWAALFHNSSTAIHSDILKGRLISRTLTQIYSSLNTADANCCASVAPVSPGTPRSAIVSFQCNIGSTITTLELDIIGHCCIFTTNWSSSGPAYFRTFNMNEVRCVSVVRTNIFRTPTPPSKITTPKFKFRNACHFLYFTHQL